MPASQPSVLWTSPQFLTEGFLCQKPFCRPRKSRKYPLWNVLGSTGNRTLSMVWVNTRAFTATSIWATYILIIIAEIFYFWKLRFVNCSSCKKGIIAGIFITFLGLLWPLKSYICSCFGATAVHYSLQQSSLRRELDCLSSCGEDW